MAKEVRRWRPDLLEAVEELAGSQVFELAGTQTRCAQPAIYCASLASWTRIGRPPAPLLAGHSMGEISALAAAGAIDELEGLRLVALRGRLMQLAADDGPANGMLAVMGRNRDVILERAEALGLSVANDNAPQQIVLAGAAADLERADRELSELGLKPIPLPVAGAFHSPLMAGAVEEFGRALATVDLRETEATVISGVTAAPFEGTRELLLGSITRPVRWREVVLALVERGTERFVELGPGRILSALVRRTVKGAHVVTADSLAEGAGV